MNTSSEGKTSLKEDVKNVIEELWEAEEEEPFSKIFTRECEKGMKKALRHSKSEIQDLSGGDNDRTVHYLRKHEAEDFRILAHYQSHLRATEVFPEDTDTFRFNYISRKDHVNFMSYPDAIALTSTGVITTNPPANTGLAEKSKVACSPADSFKKSIKRDAGIFNAFKEG